MAPPSRNARKRTIDDAASDPGRFLSAYFLERGIPESPEDDAPLLAGCMGRADGARDAFKRWREPDGPADDARPTLDLTPGEKYKRRLDNNRRSAAAARVYQEVLRREHTHALREAAAERDGLAEDVRRLGAELADLRRENFRMAEAERARKRRRTVVLEADLVAPLAGGAREGAGVCASTSATSAGENNATSVANVAGVTDVAVIADAAAVTAAAVAAAEDTSGMKNAETPEKALEEEVTQVSEELKANEVGDALSAIPCTSTVPSSSTAPRTLDELFGSQGSNKGASQDSTEDALLALQAMSAASVAPAPAPTLCLFGNINSQLSIGLAGCLQPSPTSAPSTDDFNDASQLASQLFVLSQGHASQPLASQS